MSHLSPETLGALHDGALEGAARRDAERHLEACAGCRELLAALASQDERLARALDHDPGEAYFETFADRVTQRIRSEGAGSRAAATPMSAEPWWRGLLAPRRLAWLTSAAAVVVVSVLVYVQSQETRVPVMNRERAGSEQQVAPEPQAARRAAPPAEESRDETGHLDQMAPAPIADYRDKNQRKLDGAAGGSTTGLPATRSRAAEPTVASKLSERESNTRAEALSDRLAQDTRRGSAPANLVPVKPGAREDAPAAAAARDATRPAPSAAPGVANEKPAEGLQATIQSLKRRAAAPLQKSAESGGKEIAQGFAVAPQVGELKSLSAAEQDAFAWPPELRALAAVADSLATRARQTRDASDHDAAAAAWGRVRVAATPRSSADLEARCRAADERYSSWAVEPTSARASAARMALASVLDLAPPGTRRDHYAGWLARLR